MQVVEIFFKTNDICTQPDGMRQMFLYFSFKIENLKKINTCNGQACTVLPRERRYMRPDLWKVW